MQQVLLVKFVRKKETVWHNDNREELKEAQIAAASDKSGESVFQEVLSHVIFLVGKLVVAFE